MRECLSQNLVIVRHFRRRSMSRQAVPLGYRSLQDFLLRWHSRNATPQVTRGPILPIDDAIPDAARSLGAETGIRQAPVRSQSLQHGGSRGSFYERSISSDVKPKTIQTPPEANFRPISAARIVAAGSEAHK
jgi:hypothetical protein